MVEGKPSPERQILCKRTKENSRSVTDQYYYSREPSVKPFVSGLSLCGWVGGRFYSHPKEDPRGRRFRSQRVRVADGGRTGPRNKYPVMGGGRP